MSRTEPPINLKALNQKIAGSSLDELERTRRVQIMANIVLTQMMPDGAIKGGSAMKIRMGDSATRFSKDLDVSRKDDLKSFIDKLEENLVMGWSGFSGILITDKQAKPKGVRADYVMHPYRVLLRYKGSNWASVPLEVGHDEMGDTRTPELEISQELVELFTTIGLAAPAPVPLLAVKYQIAQKLHASSVFDSPRAHDLVDLQLLINIKPIDLAELKDLCIKLFKYRKEHDWPPVITINKDWETLYGEAAHNVGVLDDVTAAVVWVNELILQIDES